MDDLYNFDIDGSTPWSRNQPDALSDFSARLAIVEHIKSLQPDSMLDLGCGEGYLAEQTKGAWGNFLGIDNSPAMVNAAHNRRLLNAYFLNADLRLLNQIQLPLRSFDVITAIFSLNYLTTKEGRTLVEFALDHLTQDGTLIVTLPHPFVTSIESRNSDFQWDTVTNYFDSDQWLTGQMRTLSNRKLSVGAFHKTFSDLLEMIPREFLQHTQIDELGFRNNTNCPTHFSKLVGKPLHVKISITKKQ